MKSLIEQKMKEQRIENSSDEFKKQYKLKTLESVLEDLDNNKNRYIFYCPDIAIVNNLSKLIYETAYEAHKAGYSVLVLHEIDGFKCKWLYENSFYKHLRDVPVDYIIKKKGAKTKRTSSQYAFKPSDTLIIPDQFQEMLDNLIDVKILQKVVFVSSFTGLATLQHGMDYKALGVSKLMFTEKTLAKGYSSLFSIDPLFINNYPVNKMFTLREEKSVLPLISVSNIGNNEFVQQVINVFYNKYPNLRIFNFRVLDRNNVELYLENLKRAALVLVLDKNLNSSQMIYEAFACGCPVGSFKRAELDDEVAEEIYFGDTAFEIADNLALFGQAWLNNRTDLVSKSVLDIKNLKEYTYDNFKVQVIDSIEAMKEDRVSFFTKVKNSFNGSISSTT
ncbi:MAG: hypothetical protein ABIP51_17155 [Bacteroidia bacterium]